MAAVWLEYVDYSLKDFCTFGLLEPTATFVVISSIRGILSRMNMGVGIWDYCIHPIAPI